MCFLKSEYSIDNLYGILEVLADAASLQEGGLTGDNAADRKNCYSLPG
jgi:hypothetical protein